jgi:hypothetical protein
VFTCPHCNKPCIPLWAKYWASTHDPAVCDSCNKASSIPGFVESISALFYALAVFSALIAFAFGVMKHRSGTLTNDYPTPSELILAVLVFYVAVEAVKVYWVPLRALSDHEVFLFRGRPLGQRRQTRCQEPFC